MQSCICSISVHLKCSLLPFSKFRTLGNSHSCCVLASPGDPTPTNTVTYSSDSSSLYTSTAQSGPSAPYSANAALLPHPRLPTSYPPFTHFVSPPSAPSPPPQAPDCFSIPPASSSHMTPSGLFDGMLEVFEPGALNFNNFFRLIPFTLPLSRNLTLNHLPLSRSLDSLLCDLIASTPDLAFSPLMPCMLAASSLFSSGRAYPCQNFLPPLFLCLTLL